MITDQHPAMDAQVQRLDQRIGKALAEREAMEKQVQELLHKIASKTAYIRALGKKRSEASTYCLFEDCA